jgi:type I restriction enzyme S subunit
MNRKMVLMKDLIHEITMGPFGSDIKVDSFIDDGVPVLNGSNINGVKLTEESFRYVSEEKAKFLKKANTKRGDIVITHRGTLGQISYIPEDSKYDNYIISQSQFRVTLKKDLVDPIYFTYYFHTNEGQKRLLSFKSHVGVPALAQATTNFRLLEFPYRSLKLQKQIAKVLSDLDAKIEINNKINQELEAMAKTLYDYWFVQFDFPDKNGKPYKSSGGNMVFNEELKREIPEGWEVKELKNISKCIMGQSPKGESYNKDEIGTPLLNGPADYENGALKGRTYTTAPTRLCEKNDMVLCIRATIGNLVYAEQEFCLGRGVAAVRPDEEKYSELIYYILLQEIERFKIQATGSIIKGITKDDLIESICLIPPDKLIDSFHNQAKSIFNKIRINKAENIKLSELRDWLLPMLMNGQVSVGSSSLRGTKQSYKESIKNTLGLVAEGDVKYLKN